MKLQQLVIHNIASIADAVIDFDKGVLAGEPLFLICGDTGTGKSTILNCICMALFNQVPSMQETKNAPKFDDRSIYNSSTLMRRGAGEAFIKLFFSDSGKSYEVDWFQRRSRNKADGNLQPLSRVLKDAGTGETLATKAVDEEISRIIGLDYNRFTRMFLLPQGQFNKFLTAGENDKSYILEQLTHLGIYKSIGQYIHRRLVDEKERYERIDQKIKDIHLLTDEEKETKRREMELAKEEVSKVSDQLKSVNDKLQWWKTFFENCRAMEDAQSQLESSKRCMESEENRHRLSLLRLWDSTGDLRQCRSQIASLKNTIADNEKKLHDKQQDFLCYRSWLALSKKDLAEKTELLKKDEIRFGQLEPNRSSYENVQTIVSDFHSIIRLETLNREAQKKIEINQEKLKQDEDKISLAETGYKQKLSDEEQMREERDRKQAEMNASGKSSLQSQHDQLQNELTDISTGKGKWQLANNAAGALSDKQQEIAISERNLKSLTNNCDAACKLSDAKDDVYKECKAAYDLRKLTIDECSQKLRQSLEDGKPCPICGSTHHEKRDEKFFVDLYQKADDDLTKIQKEKEDAHNTLTRLQTLCTEKRESLKKAREAGSLLQQKMDDAMDGWKPFAVKYAADRAFEKSFTSLEMEEKECMSRLSAINSKLAVISDMEQVIDLLRKKYEKAQSVTADAKKSLDDLTAERRNLMHDNDSYQTQIDVNNKEANVATEALNGLLTDPDWQLSWNNDRDGYEQRLTLEAKQYNDYSLQIPMQRHSIGQMETDIRLAGKSVQDIIALLPSWDLIDEKIMTPLSAESLSGKFSALAATVAEIEGSIDKDRIRADELNKQQLVLLHGYEATYGVIDPMQLDWLSATSDVKIISLRRESDLLTESLSLAQGRLTQLKDARDRLTAQTDRPAEEETASCLTVQQGSFSIRSSELQQNIGGLQAQLDADKAYESDRQSLLEEQNRQREIYDRWSTLDKQLGGERLSRAAQSITFRFLLEKANEHLKQLYPRYRLECPNDSLALLVNDMEMATVRPGTTLSGGESFIVSLALALGLSSLTDEKIRVETLFIDEGFGTLSEECLDTVLNVLENLHRQGRKVGIVSHVQMLRERIPAQIRLERVSRTQSEVHVVRL